jgi:NAD(P)H-hydrate epimerase
MAALEAELFASGLPVEALMEKAGLALSRRLRALADLRSRPSAQLGIGADGVVVLVGPGHNGGDGLVVARELHLAGVPVRLWSPFERRKPLTDQHWQHAHWLGIPTLAEPPGAADPALWIDALFGNGQARPPGEAIEALLAERAGQRGGVVAIDVPTGLCSDSGAPLGTTAARADLTLCLGLWKRGLVQDRALAWVGALERLDLDLPLQRLAPLTAGIPLGLGGVWSGGLADAQQAPRPLAPEAAGKYERGRLLVVAGSGRYLGAAHLALAGATASGCGSLRALVPPGMADHLWQLHPHVVLEQSGPTGPGLERLDAVVVGPGLGHADGKGLADDPVPEAWWHLLQRFAGLVVVDADGLRHISPGWLRERHGPTWITPHGAEFARLFPDLAQQAQHQPLDAASEAAGRTGATVLLKGARSVIASADGRRWQLMLACGQAARAGLGDVLAGYAAGLGARGWATAACCDGQLLAVAALDHAEAGCDCVRRLGPGGASPQAIAQQLAQAGAPGQVAGSPG